MMSARSLVAPAGGQVHGMDDGPEAVKNRYPAGAAGAFLQSAFPDIY
jgi:hypothetical protein